MTRTRLSPSRWATLLADDDIAEEAEAFAKHTKERLLSAMRMRALLKKKSHSKLDPYALSCALQEVEYSIEQFELDLAQVGSRLREDAKARVRVADLAVPA